jgi:chromosome partitioning protein
VDRRKRAVGTYTMLLDGQDPGRLVQTTLIPGLDIIPADPDLAGAEIELVGMERREFRLRDALAKLAGYEYVLIDCPPSLSLLTLNGLVAASAVLVPLQCEFFALEGISQLVHTIDLVKRGLNPRLVLQGIVLTMFDRRNNLSDLVAADARSFFGDRVYETVIPRNIRISEAPSHGKPVLLYDRTSAGALAYVKLAEEVLRQCLKVPA